MRSPNLQALESEAVFLVPVFRNTAEVLEKRWILSLEMQGIGYVPVHRNCPIAYSMKTAQV